jgi:hypothetical protein
MVRAANNSEIAKAVVHHTINRLSEGELENTFITDLYSLFPAAIEMNIQDTNAHTMHSARTANQDSFTEPMSIPAITSRKEINAASLYREVPAVSGRTSRASAVEYGTVSGARGAMVVVHGEWSSRLKPSIKR